MASITTLSGMCHSPQPSAQLLARVGEASLVSVVGREAPEASYTNRGVGSLSCGVGLRGGNVVALPPHS